MLLTSMYVSMCKCVSVHGSANYPFLAKCRNIQVWNFGCHRFLWITSPEDVLMLTLNTQRYPCVRVCVCVCVCVRVCVCINRTHIQT